MDDHKSSASSSARWCPLDVAAVLLVLFGLAVPASAQTSQFKSILTSADSVAIIELRSEDLFSCYNALSEWIPIAHRDKWQVWLYLLDSPTQEVRHRIRRLRLPFNLAEAPSSAADAIGRAQMREVLVINGTMRDSSISPVSVQTSVLLGRLPH